MRSPSLIHDSQFFVSGDVTIHPTAAIAPGVLLQADPGCRLVIEAGVCVGIGAILHAHQGNVIIKAGVTLGSGVLIVGQVMVGENACIGSATTLLNQSISPQQHVAAGSLIGDNSRQTDLTEQVGEFVEPPAAPQNDSAQGSTQENPPPAAQVIYGRAYLEKIMVTMFPSRQMGNQAINSPPENLTSG
jgi:carbon dioxide concentrating mechanism protein CcmN